MFSNTIFASVIFAERFDWFWLVCLFSLFSLVFFFLFFLFFFFLIFLLFPFFPLPGHHPLLFFEFSWPSIEIDLFSPFHGQNAPGGINSSRSMCPDKLSHGLDKPSWKWGVGNLLLILAWSICPEDKRGGFWSPLVKFTSVRKNKRLLFNLSKKRHFFKSPYDRMNNMFSFPLSKIISGFPLFVLYFQPIFRQNCLLNPEPSPSPSVSVAHFDMTLGAQSSRGGDRFAGTEICIREILSRCFFLRRKNNPGPGGSFGCSPSVWILKPRSEGPHSPALVGVQLLCLPKQITVKKTTTMKISQIHQNTWVSPKPDAVLRPWDNFGGA